MDSHSDSNAARQMESAATSILERMADGVLLFGLNGQCVYANEIAGHLLGRVANELPGKTKEQVLPHSIAGEREGSDQNSLDYFSPKTSRWYQVRTSTTQQGECVLFFDVTERKLLEAQLREREGQFVTLVEHLPDVVFRLDLHLRHLYISPIIEQITGYTPSAWLGKTGREMGLSADVQDRFETLCQQAIMTGQEQQMEFNHQGTWQRSRIIPEYATDGSISALMGITQDITEYKRRELRTTLIADLTEAFSSLSTQEEMLQVAGKRMIQYFDVSSLTVAQVNEAANEFTVLYDSNDGTNVSRTYPLARYVNEDFLREMKAERVLVVNDVLSNPFTAAVSGDFESFPVRAFVLASHVSKGQVDFVVGMQHLKPYNWREDEIDLLHELIARIYPQLERVRAEQELRESRAEAERQRRFFEKIFDNLSSSVFVWDRQHRYLYINRTLEKIWGIEHGAAVGKTSDDLGIRIPAETDKFLRGQVEQVFETGKDVTGESPYTNPFGVNGYYEYTFGPVFAPDGSVEFVAGLSQDVSERKRIEEALRESEARFRLLIETYAQTVWVTNAAGEVVEDSASWRAYTGQTFEEWIGYGWVNALHPDDREYAERQWREAIASEHNVNAEFRLKYADNGYRWTNVLATPLHSDDGSIVKWVGMNIDIHDRKFAEEQYRLLFDTMEQGVHLGELLRDKQEDVIDIRILQVNRAWQKIMGISPETIIGKRLSQWLPNTENDWIKLCERVIRTGRSERDEQHVGTLNRWFEVFVSPLGEDRFMALFTDTTERKRMEQALHDSEKRVQAERQRLHDLFMAAPAGIAVVQGPEHVYELANSFVLQILGTHRSIIGKPIREALPDMKEQGFYDLLDSVYQTGQTVTGNEIPAHLDRTGDGTLDEVYLNFVYQPSYNAAGEIDGVLTYANDVTDIVLARKRVEESEERFRTLANSMPQLVWSASVEGEIDFFNEQLNKYATMPRNEDGIYQWQAIVHPDDRERTKHIWERAMRTGSMFENEQRMHMKDGSYRWHLVRGIPIRNEDGSVSPRWYGTKTDIEQLKQLEQQRTDFIGVASHELKTPVTSAKAFAEVLENRFRRAGDEKSATLLGKMNAQMEKLTRLINDLLDVTKIEAGKLQFHEEFFPFDTLVNDILEEVQRITTTHTLQRERTTDATVYGDRERIGQVLTNLLTNAIKYSPNASTVVVSTSSTEQEVTLCVQDFGIGIAEDKLPHVFERFFRETGAREDTFAGLGLGLYVACEIISRQGGKIWAESEKGQGSTFCFSLPVGGSKNTRRSDDMFVEDE